MCISRTNRAESFHTLILRLGERAGMLFPIHPHMLRHGCGYALANAGHDTRAIQAWMGHKNIQHTMRYTELLTVNVAAKSSDQKATEPPPAPTPVVAEVPPEVLQQLQTIVSDLAVLRHTIEEIASKQDQTSRDVASIEAAEQNLSKQISSLARVTAVRPAAQKSSHTQPKQSTAAILAPQPERPPLPVPAARAAPAN